MLPKVRKRQRQTRATHLVLVCRMHICAWVINVFGIVSHFYYRNEGKITRGVWVREEKRVKLLQTLRLFWFNLLAQIIFNFGSCLLFYGYKLWLFACSCFYLYVHKIIYKNLIFSSLMTLGEMHLFYHELFLILRYIFIQ